MYYIRNMVHEDFCPIFYPHSPAGRSTWGSRSSAGRGRLEAALAWAQASSPRPRATPGGSGLTSTAPCWRPEETWEQPGAPRPTATLDRK